MNDDLSLKTLWSSLTPEEVEGACRCLLEFSDPGQPRLREKVLDSLAVSMRFRPVFVRRRSNAENLPFLVMRIRSKELERFRKDAIKLWLLTQHASLLTTFLQASGIPNKDGFVDGDPPVPSVQQLEAGIASILAEFRARDVAVYLGYLLLDDGSFFAALSPALEIRAIHLAELMTTGDKPVIQEFPSNATEEVASLLPEDSDQFTTLDDWLIRAVVSAAFGESGALRPEQLEEMVDEIVSLNAQRQQSLFHRGFLHVLFEKPCEFHFPGENEERRLWYFTGVLFGHLRARRQADVLRLLKENDDIYKQLCRNVKVRCGSMLLRHLHPILWDAREFEMLQLCLEHQLVRLPEDASIGVTAQIHYDASASVRRGNIAEAEWFLNFVDRVLRTSTRLPVEFVKLFLPQNDRKRAQVLQLKGKFDQAEALLKPLSESGELGDAGNALCDRALIRGGFRSLVAVLPRREVESGVVIADALQPGRELLERAVAAYPGSATNAQFCLGLVELMKQGDAQSAADHMSSALAGMLSKEEAYSQGGIIQWTRFLLGLALLETAVSPNFQRARDYIEQSIETPVVFPMWLWSRVMEAAAVFDDQSLGQRIAEHLLKKRGSEAYEAIWRSGLAKNVNSLRETYLEWLEVTALPVRDKWQQLMTLLPFALRDTSSKQGESILDLMEGIAIQGAMYRIEFLDLLQDDRNYSPAWEIDDVTNVRIKLHELQGNFVDAIALLRERYFVLRENGTPTRCREAQSVLDWMAELGADESDVQTLRGLIPREGAESNSADCLLRAGSSVKVIFIGGNEVQMAYEDGIRAALRENFPGLEVDFYFPGWDSSWNIHLERVRPGIMEADVVVLSPLVRTQFGAHVRRICGVNRPWFPCTGKGKASMQRSIEEAARWAANQRRPKN